MKTKAIAIAAGAAIAALALATWASPHWQLYRMYAAVEARDAQVLSAYVDFPKLRESVKLQVMRRLGADGAPEASRSNPFAAFGRAMAAAVIDPLVDAAVSPAGVVAMLDAGDIRVEPTPEAGPPPPAGSEAAGPREEVNYELSYRSWSQVVVEREDGGGVAFLLDRHGLWSWKLAGVELREDR